MIILNQDKDEIINFDNTASIYLVDEWDDKPGIVIKADNIHGSVSTLGYYKNSDRAKEVLQNIINWYAGDAMVEYNGFIYYEMPKE